MDSEKHIELGSWIGLQQAFAVVTGSCAAARAQCLKQVRDSKMLDSLGFTWDEFCKDYAGVSRQHADHLIQQYAEFGDAFFRLSEIARVSSRTFRQIAPHVDGETIEIDGEKLALTPANASRIRAAIQSLRQRTRPAAAASRPPAGVIELQLRVDGFIADLENSVRAPVPADSRRPLYSLIASTMSKLRALARQLESDPETPPQ